ncbi:MAG: hypothetical protein ACLQPD_14170 [Desulfomonilaceae bacterium]
MNVQRKSLYEIVKTTRAIATELRRFLRGESADEAKVLLLSRRYGELDGEMSYLYATTFAEVGQSLTGQRKERLTKMRTSNPSDRKGPFCTHHRWICRKSRTRISCLTPGELMLSCGIWEEAHSHAVEKSPP